MDQRMFSAACSGDVNTLHHLLQENSFILSDYALMNSSENPLTIAVKANQRIFVREILKLKPELGMELNQAGVRPLDVASAYGNVEIVREILVAGPEICRLRGREGRAAIHYAAMNGRVEIIDELISASLDCVRDVTTFRETVLHLAVKYCNFEALKSVLLWLEKLGMVEMVNWGDMEGNTVLHYAVSRKQLESVELLVDWNNKAGNRVLELNAVNKKGLTAVDILDILIESSSDVHLREILRRSGSCAASEFNIVSERLETDNKQPINNHLPAEKPNNWQEIRKLFKFKWGRDSPGEARAVLLVVAALIATVTFEAGINPPSYLFEQPNETNFTITSQYPNGSTVSNPNNSNITVLLNGIQRSSAESSSMVSITVFLVANSVALSTATTIIDYLTADFPFQRELRVSMYAMIFAYGWSLGNTKPKGIIKDVMLILAVSMPLFLRWRSYFVKIFLKQKTRV